MVENTSTTSPGLVMNRRVVLGMGVAGVTTAAAARLPAHADTMDPRPGQFRFAMVADAHQNPAAPVPLDNMARVWAHMEPRRPDMVVNVGDLTSYGSAAQLDTYRAGVPESLRDRVRVVPGNHEVAWDAQLLAEYRARFGATHYSFDMAGIHFVALDPLIALESPQWRFGPKLLRWLKTDLERVDDDVPVVIFMHFPVDGSRFVVSDAAEFLKITARHNVRAIFCGHVHKRIISEYNGMVQVLGAAVKLGPVYYWISDRVDAQRGRLLEVFEENVPANAEPSSELVATIPLEGPRPALDLRMRLAARENAAGVTVTAIPGRQAPTTVRARWQRQAYRGKYPWVELTRSQGRWVGSLDRMDRLAGRHRIQVWASDADGAVFQDVVEARLSGPGPRVGWSVDIGGERAAGSVLAAGSSAVVATVDGAVRGLAVRRDGASTMWRRQVGPVFRSGVYDSRGRHVVIPSADGCLYALSSRTGGIRWRVNLGDPVICDVHLGEIDGRRYAFVVAGRWAHAVDLVRGKVLWRSDIDGTFVGRMTSDADAAYVGSSDGSLRALRLRDGRQLWLSDITQETDPGRRQNKGPWMGTLRVLADGGVVATGNNWVSVVDPDGSLRWKRDAGYGRARDTPTMITPQGIMILEGKKQNAVHLLDPVSGDDLWTAETPASFNAGPVRTTSPGRYWMHVHTGELISIDTIRRQVVSHLRVAPEYTYSTAALVGSKSKVLVTVGQDGVVRGVVDLPKLG